MDTNGRAHCVHPGAIPSIQSNAMDQSHDEVIVVMNQGQSCGTNQKPLVVDHLSWICVNLAVHEIANSATTNPMKRTLHNPKLGIPVINLASIDIFHYSF